MTDSKVTKHYADLVIAARGLGEQLIDTGIVDPEQLRFTIVAREDRKRVVPALKAEGLSNREIARTLGVSPQTVGRELAVPNGTPDVPNGTNVSPDHVTEAQQAERAAEAARREAEEVEENQRKTFLRIAADTYRGAGAFAVPQFRAGLIERLADRKFASMLAQQLRLGVEGAPTIKEMLIGANELAKILRGVIKS